MIPVSSSSPYRHLCRFLLIGLLLSIVTGCASGPTLPADIQGKSLIVLGFTSNQAKPYEGGTLYTGMYINKLDGNLIEPAMHLYDYRIVEPGSHIVEGHCYWRLRGDITLSYDDLNEPGKLVLTTRPNHRYTLQCEIDEYKNRCDISVVETPHPDN